MNTPPSFIESYYSSGAGSHVQPSSLFDPMFSFNIAPPPPSHHQHNEVSFMSVQQQCTF
jgi:hypothetical protein